MKKTVLIFLLAIPSLAFCQLLSGIGPFKIGITTTDIIDSLSKDGLHGVVETNDYLTFVDPPTHNIYIPTFDSPVYPALRDVKYYMIGYVVVSGIGITNLRLKFYKNRLYEIHTGKNVFKLTEALELKYGKPKLTGGKKNIYCQNGFGAVSEKEEFNYRHIFKSPANVESIWIFRKYYTDKCEERILNYVIISDKKTWSTVRNIEIKRFNDRDNIENKEKLKPIKEL